MWGDSDLRCRAASSRRALLPGGQIFGATNVQLEVLEDNLDRHAKPLEEIHLAVPGLEQVARSFREAYPELSADALRRILRLAPLEAKSSLEV